MSYGVCFEDRNAFLGSVRGGCGLFHGARFRVDWIFRGVLCLSFFLKVVLVMDSGCSLRGTLRASRQECCDYTLSDAVPCLAPSLQQKFFHIFTLFPGYRVVFCI